MITDCICLITYSLPLSFSFDPVESIDIHDPDISNTSGDGFEVANNCRENKSYMSKNNHIITFHTVRGMALKR